MISVLAMVEPIAEWCAIILEIIGIATITIIALYITATIFYLTYKRVNHDVIFRVARNRLGRGILLGLEFLVAADIVYTVTLEATFRSVGILGAIVLIRTFLSFTLDVELTGHWPWQRGRPGRGGTVTMPTANQGTVHPPEPE